MYYVTLKSSFFFHQSFKQTYYYYVFNNEQAKIKVFREHNAHFKSNLFICRYLVEFD